MRMYLVRFENILRVEYLEDQKIEIWNNQLIKFKVNVDVLQNKLEF